MCTLKYVLYVERCVDGVDRRLYLAEGGYTDTSANAKLFDSIPADFEGFVVMYHEKVEPNDEAAADKFSEGDVNRKRNRKHKQT